MFNDIEITLEQFQASDWEAIIDNEKMKTCEHYCQLFAEAKHKANEEHKVTNEEIYSLLGAASSMYINLGSKTAPLSPGFVFQNGRSAIIDDFSESQIEFFCNWMDVINDPELKSRLADICWQRKSDYKIALITIDEYLLSADRLLSIDNTSWIYSEKRIERALTVAVSLGIENAPFKKVTQYIESLLTKKGWIDLSFFSLQLMRLLQKYRVGDVERYTQFCINSATYLESQSEFYRARHYWDMARQWCNVSKNENLQKRMQIRIAMTHELEADYSLNLSNPQYMVVVSHLENAVQAYRRIGGMQDVIERIHQKMLEYEVKVKEELKEFQTSIDIRDAVETSRNLVKGQTLDKSIKILALCISSPNVDELRKRVIEYFQEFPLQFLFSKQNINDKGKVTGKVPAMEVNGDESENEGAIQAEMYHQSRISQSLSVASFIQPIRLQINLDNPNIHEYDFAGLVNNNPFIPEGREVIFARGLFEGLKGDFLLSTSLLIPQLENSIRFMFERNGVITSSLDQNGIQKELSLNDLFDKPEAKKIFGNDLLFDLRGLLSENLGSNLRNLVSHGLIDHDLFYSSESAYLWWLTIRLLVLLLIPSEKDSADAATHEATEPENE